MLVNQFPECDAHRHFVVARALDVSADTEDARAGALGRGTDRRKPFGTTSDDVRQVRQRFHVIDHGRLVIESVRSGKRRLYAGESAFSFGTLTQSEFSHTTLRD